MSDVLEVEVRARCSDGVLVDAIAARDEQALREAYRRHGAQALRAASGRCGAAHADEVVQELFLRLWERPELFDPGRGTLRGFLVGQAQRRAIDVLRREGAWQARHSRHGAPAEAAPSVEASAMERLAGEEARRLLRTLPAAEREAIELAYLGGHTYRDVARLLGRPEGTVKSQVRTGLRRLREALVTSPSWA